MTQTDEEIYHVLDWKSQYCKNDYTTQSNLQIQRNPYQIINGIFHRLRKTKLQFVWKTQKIPNSQSNLKENQSWTNQAPWLHTILQSCSNQDGVALQQKQKYRSMEQDRKPIDKLVQLCPHNLWQRRQEYTMEKRQLLQSVLLGKLDSYMYKNKTGTLPNTTHSNKLKTD